MTTVPEEAVKAAILAYQEEAKKEINHFPVMMRAALTAAIPFLTVQGAVKKLAWIRPPLSDTLSRCDTDFGTYRTWTHDEANGKWFWSVEGGWNEANGEAPNEEAAKAAAQADYEARVMSAIEPVVPVSRPSAARELALEEAAKNCEREAAEVEGLIDDVAYHLRKRAAAIRALSSPDHADAGKVEGDGWLDIASAPMDKTPVIIAVPTKDKDGFIVGEAYFDPENYEGDWWWAGTSHTDHFDSPISEINHNAPTHWRPLPSAPSQEVAGS